MILTESAYESALLTNNNSRLVTRKLVAKRYLLLLNLLFAQTADVRASVKMMQELHYSSDRIPFTPVNANVRVSERSRGLCLFIGDSGLRGSSRRRAGYLLRRSDKHNMCMRR